MMPASTSLPWLERVPVAIVVLWSCVVLVVLVVLEFTLGVGFAAYADTHSFAAIALTVHLYLNIVACVLFAAVLSNDCCGDTRRATCLAVLCVAWSVAKLCAAAVSVVVLVTRDCAHAGACVGLHATEATLWPVVGCVLGVAVCVCNDAPPSLVYAEPVSSFV